MPVEWVEFDNGRIKLALGDCLDVLPTLEGVDAIVTDPPYGILNLDGEGSTTAVRKSPRQQGSGTLKNRLLNVSDVRWDTAPPKAVFDTLRSLATYQIIWGGNYFPLPPARGILVWDKEQPWPNFSQAEFAWTNICRPAALFRESATRGTPNKVHPTQKPLRLMEWCIGLLPSGETILDPYMGVATTGIACIRLGRKFLGIEREPKYFDIAVRRIEAELRQPRLFPAAAPVETQRSFLEPTHD